MGSVNADKEKVIVTVNRLLDRSGLSIEQVIARMQSAGIDLSRSVFENRFTTRVQQKPNIPPECLIALVASFTERLKPNERMTAHEAIELATTARLPFEQFQELRQFFVDSEFAAAFEQAISHIIGTRVYRTNGSMDANGAVHMDALATEEWGDAPDIGRFHGREDELLDLSDWVQLDKCRLVLILGMGGMGKTTLTKKLAEQVRPDFDYLFWKSLRNAPPIEEVVDECLRFLFGDQEVDPNFNISQRISLLVRRLRSRRCLIIIDGMEAILREGVAGDYLQGYEGYEELLQQVGQVAHRSCFLLTSREKPSNLALVEGPKSPIRTLELDGIGVDAARQILDGRKLLGDEEAWQQLVRGYSGNPMALKLASEPIDEVYGGDIHAFLKRTTPIFTDIRDLLDAHLSRLSTVLERSILYWLAIEREAIVPEILRTNFLKGVAEAELVDALRSLRRRSLIEHNASGLTLQNVVMEYMTERFVELMSNEIEAEMSFMLSDFPIMQVQTKEYIRNSQIRLILKPIVERVQQRVGRETLIDYLFSILERLRAEARASKTSNDGATSSVQSYAAGNILNLLTYLGVDLRHRNFSELVIRQADLRGVALQDVDLSHTDCRDTVFSQTFGSITSVDFSPDGRLVAAGIANGDIRVWEVNVQLPHINFSEHSDLVWAVAFSPSGRILASGSQDQSIRLWDIHTGECIARFMGHSEWVKDLAFSYSDTWLASCGNDGKICLWDYELGERLSAIDAHDGWIWSIAFSPDDRILASAGQDGLIKLWDTGTEECIQTLQAHNGPIRAINFSPEGSMVGTASFDHTVRLWMFDQEKQQIELYKTFNQHKNLVWSVTFSRDSLLCASAGDDQCVRIWRTDTGELLRTLQGHNNRVWDAAFSPDGRSLVSGSDDQTLRYWDVATGRSMHILEGYSNQIWTVTYHHQSSILAAGGDDNQIYLWQDPERAGQLDPPTILTGHSDRVRSVACSPNSAALVSGGDDQTIRIWDIENGKETARLNGHTSRIWSVAISPNGRTIASGSEDNTIRLWRMQSGRCFRILENESRVWSVAFSPDNALLASASDGHCVCLWTLHDGTPHIYLSGHEGRVWSVAFSPDGSKIASASDDQTVRIWDVQTGTCEKVLVGHTDLVWSVSFHPNGKQLISGGDDRTICLWDVESGACQRTYYAHTSSVLTIAFGANGTFFSGSADQFVRQWNVSTEQYVRELRADRPYERMNVTGLKGLTPVQIDTLKVLGAIET